MHTGWRLHTGLPSVERWAEYDCTSFVYMRIVVGWDRLYSLVKKPKSSAPPLQKLAFKHFQSMCSSISLTVLVWSSQPCPCSVCLCSFNTLYCICIPYPIPCYMVVPSQVSFLFDFNNSRWSVCNFVSLYCYPFLSLRDLSRHCNLVLPQPSSSFTVK
jgi:hypothetical protein